MAVISHTLLACRFEQKDSACRMLKRPWKGAPAVSRQIHLCIGQEKCRLYGRLAESRNFQPVQ